jgi:hypothetical protein
MPSRVIRFFQYDAPRQELLIVFRSGRKYVYHEVPEATYRAMLAAFSKGEYFNAHVRDRFRYTERQGFSGR